MSIGVFERLSPLWLVAIGFLNDWAPVQYETPTHWLRKILARYRTCLNQRKSRKNKAIESPREPSLWFSRVSVETWWKHRAILLILPPTRGFSVLLQYRDYVSLLVVKWMNSTRFGWLRYESIYRFEHIVAYSSGKVVAKSDHPVQDSDSHNSLS